MPSGTGTCHSRNTVRRAPASVSIPVRSEFGDFSGGVTQADMQEDTALRSVSGDLEPKWECVGCKAWGLLSLNPVTAQLPGGSEATFCLRPGSREAWCPLCSCASRPDVNPQEPAATRHGATEEPTVPFLSRRRRPLVCPHPAPGGGGFVVTSRAASLCCLLVPALRGNQGEIVTSL